MNSYEFSQITHILSKILQKNTRVMDLCCGDGRFTKWIKNTGIASLVPVSPNDMEHISHENPFVAYNNFINDDRKIPTKDHKADVILMLGPLYNMQSEEKRKQTLEEAKRLLSVRGKIITLTIDIPNKDEKSILAGAGFSPESIINIAKTQKGISTDIRDRKTKFHPKKSTKQGVSKGEFVDFPPSTEQNSNYFLSVAKRTPIPKPALGINDIPPEVLIRIPNDVLERIKKQEQEYNEQQKIFGIDRENLQKNSNKSTRKKENYYSNIEIKESIDPTLQYRKKVQKSIDPTLQPNDFADNNSGYKIDLPILPKVILDEYRNNNNSNKEINSKKKEEKKPTQIISIAPETEDKEKESNKNTPRDLSPDKIPKHPPIPLQPSIDKDLIMRENMSNRLKMMKIKEEYAKVHPSIDKTLQMSLSKIDPKFAKQKSLKKGTRNLIQRNIRSSR